MTSWRLRRLSGERRHRPAGGADAADAGLGHEFLTLPFDGRTAGDVIRVYAGWDDTTVSVNGALVATLKQGAFYQTSRTTAARIVT